LCASHSRETRVGAPKGNKNAVKHGLYAVPPPQSPPADRGGRRSTCGVQSGAADRGGGMDIRRVPSLDDEIALLVSRRNIVDNWMINRLEAGDEVDVLKYLALIGQIGSRIARMLKTRDALGGSGDIIEGLFSEVLDLLNEQVDVEV